MAYRSLLLLIFFSQLAAAQEYKWYGDLRIRAQREKEVDAEVRNIIRFRARFGVAVQIDENLRAEIRLASAKSNRSNNQSMGDQSEPGSRRRFIGLDLGYVEWKPFDFAKLYAGRFSGIHFRPGDSQIILDDDLSLEGAGLALDYEFLPDFKVFLNAGSAYIRENYDNYYAQDLSDNMLNFAQTGVTWQRDRYRVIAGGGFFNFTSVQGKNFADLVSGGKPDGNSESSAGVIKNPYLPRHYFIDGKLPLGSMDLGLFGEFIENRESSDPNQAWWTGLSLGQKSWDLQLGVTEIESDAVLAMFTQSDFGNGKTDTRGYLGAIKWKFARNMSVKFCQFYGWNNMSSKPTEYDRSHIDLNASF